MKYYSLFVPALICGFCIRSSDFWTSIQVSMSTRHNLSFCACKTTWWAPELPVSMCPSSHLWFLHPKQRILDQNYKSSWVPDLICGFCMQNSDFWACIQVSIGTRPHLSFCACKTAWLASELLGSMGASLHLWYLHAKQRVLEQNYMSLWVPAFTCRFVLAKQRD